MWLSACVSGIVNCQVIAIEEYMLQSECDYFINGLPGTLRHYEVGGKGVWEGDVGFVVLGVWITPLIWCRRVIGGWSCAHTACALTLSILRWIMIAWLHWVRVCRYASAGTMSLVDYSCARWCSLVIMCRMGFVTMKPGCYESDWAYCWGVWLSRAWLELRSRRCGWRS